MMHLDGHNYVPIRKYENKCFYVLLIYQLPSCLTFWDPHKLIYFPHEFGNGSHDKYKILGKTSIKLNHYVKYMNLLWIIWNKHLNMAWIFLRFGNLPSLETIILVSSLKIP